MDEQMIERLHEWHDEAVDLGYDEMHVPTEWITTVFAAHSVIAARVAELEELLWKAAPFVGWASTREQIIAGVDAAELCDKLDAALAPHPKGTDKLIELAERCEAATGPDRELDRCLFAVKRDVEREDVTGPIGFSPTASLDAAMTLYVRVPESIPSNPRLAAAEALRQLAENV